MCRDLRAGDRIDIWLRGRWAQATVVRPSNFGVIVELDDPIETHWIPSEHIRDVGQERTSNPPG
jgi:hypothetical protein